MARKIKTSALTLSIAIMIAFGCGYTNVDAAPQISKIQKWGPAAPNAPRVARTFPDKKGKGRGHAHGHYKHGSPSFSSFSVTPYGFSYSRSGRNGGVQLNIPIRPRYSGYYQSFGYGTPYGYGNQAGIYSPNSQYAYGGGLSGTGSGYQPYGGYYNSPDYRRDSELSSNLDRYDERLSTMRPRIPNNTINSLDAGPMPFVTTNRLANIFQRKAEQAFRTGRYSEAARLANEALLVDKQNGVLMLFSAQANFAAGYYRQAINEISEALPLLPPEKWGYIVANYKEIYGLDDFVTQMDRLSGEISQNRTIADFRILRGFQYAGLGYPDAAAKDFNEVLIQQPGNRLALDLLRGMTGTQVLQISPESNRPIQPTDAPILIGPIVEPTVDPAQAPTPAVAPPAQDDLDPVSEPQSIIESLLPTESAEPSEPAFTEPEWLDDSTGGEEPKLVDPSGKN